MAMLRCSCLLTGGIIYDICLNELSHPSSAAGAGARSVWGRLLQIYAKHHGWFSQSAHQKLNLNMRQPMARHRHLGDRSQSESIGARWDLRDNGRIGERLIHSRANNNPPIQWGSPTERVSKERRLLRRNDNCRTRPGPLIACC
jgi:hypothetical protein